jgi:hypothetical protein
MSIKHRVANTPPTAGWDSLQMLLDEKKTALLLGVSLSYLRKARCEGAHHNRTPGPLFVQVGGRIYYRRADLKDWVNNLVSRQVL